MDAWKDVDARINAPESRYQVTENIFIRIDCRTEVRSIREQGADEKTDRHSCEKEETESVKFVRITEEKVSDRHSDKSEPEHIWNYKVFNKRNLIIQRGVDNMKFCSHMLL